MFNYILLINPGSTSLKFALFLNEKKIFSFNVEHDINELKALKSVTEHCSYREKVILTYLEQNNFNYQKIKIIMARGGLLKPVKSGIYLINEKMLNDLENNRYGYHASNFAAIIANNLAQKLKIKAYICNPVVVDEMKMIAKITGLKGITRKSIFHALNHKSVGRLAAKKLNKSYEKCNFIIAHLGGGISIAAHYQGQVIDVNNALNGEGPFSPERSGTLPMIDLINLVRSKKYSYKELLDLLTKEAGLYSYFKTKDFKKLEQEIDNSMEVKLVIDAMIYQIAKAIGSYSTVLKGKINAIVLTGGLAYSRYIIKNIKSYISWLAKIIIIAGENELKALVVAALNVINKNEIILEY